MSYRYSVAGLLVFSIVAFTPAVALAETPDQVLSILKVKAVKKIPGFQQFSAIRGENFFKVKHGQDWSCASCHTKNPAVQGRHAVTNKPIDPLAPSGNAERFTSLKKTEKWFKRNCKDVLDRVCTEQEKGDVLSYLLTVHK